MLAIFSSKMMNMLLIILSEDPEGEKKTQEPSPQLSIASNERNPQEPSQRILPHFKNPEGYKDIVFCLQENVGHACTYSPKYQSNMQVTADNYVDTMDLQMEGSLFKQSASRLKRGQHSKHGIIWSGSSLSNDSDKEQLLSASHAKLRRRNWDPGNREVTKFCMY